MVEDPGYVQKSSSRNQQREVVQKLFEQWKFDEENFCVPCMSRKPMRSKHCRRCGRCVAKHDQYVQEFFVCLTCSLTSRQSLSMDRQLRWSE